MDHILYPFVGHDPVKGIGDCIKYLRGRSEAEQKASVHIVSLCQCILRRDKSSGWTDTIWYASLMSSLDTQAPGPSDSTSSMAVFIKGYFREHKLSAMSSLTL